MDWITGRIVENVLRRWGAERTANWLRRGTDAVIAEELLAGGKKEKGK